MKRLVPVILVGLIIAGGIIFLDSQTDNVPDPVQPPDNSGKPADPIDGGKDGGKEGGKEGGTPSGEGGDDTQEGRINRLISLLGAAEVEDREKAQQALLAMGQPVVSFLREARLSPIPEISSRAKYLLRILEAKKAITDRSFSESLSWDTILFAETMNAKQLQARWKKTAMAKLWSFPATRVWYAGYQKSEYDADDIRDIQFKVDLVQAIDRRAAVILGPPATVDSKEVYAPFVFAGEAAEATVGHIENLARRVFSQLGDSVDGRRNHGPFVIEGHISAQTVYHEKLGFLSLMPIGMESLLNGLLANPKVTLAPLMVEARNLISDADFAIHVARDGLDELVGAGHELDEDHVAFIDLMGMTKGSTLGGAVKLSGRDIEERYVIRSKDSAGLLPTLANLPLADRAKREQAMDLMVGDAEAWFSIKGQVAAKAKQITQVLRALDKLNTLPVPTAKLLPGQDPKTVKKIAPPKDPKIRRVRWDPLYEPKIDRFERLTGLKFEQFIEQVDGGLEISMFSKAMKGGKNGFPADEPDDIPLAFLVGMVLKDSKIVTQALEHAAAAKSSPIAKKPLAGGTLYYFQDDFMKPGWWLKGRYLAFVTEENVAVKASAALAGKNRLEARADIKTLRAAKTFAAESRVTIYGNGADLFEMPYKLAHINLNWDEENMWPNYKLLKGFLGNIVIEVSPGAKPGDVYLRGKTPFSMAGCFELFRQPLEEAGF